MDWLPSDADMHFVLGLLVGGLIVAGAIGPNIDRRRAIGRHHSREK